MAIIIICVVIIIISFVRVVPKNTAIIIDRNEHYLKTVKKGFYFFNPKTDKITTTISILPHIQRYSQISETHDGLLYELYYSVTYRVGNINSVLESLKSNRRSVNDIIQSCVRTSTGNFEKEDMKNPHEFVDEIKRRLAVNMDSFEIELIDFNLYSSVQRPGSYRDKVFAPHISEGIKSIKYK